MAELKKLHIDTPNNRYEERDLGTWSSVSDVDAFMKAYNHDNNYEGLSLGNYVTIQDGTYNGTWMIAGFDTEYNKGIPNTGYGITFIPKTILFSAPMNDTATTVGGYYGSKMFQTTLPSVANILKGVLGDHLLNRPVQVTNSVSGNEASSTIWATAYLSLMSENQVYGSRIYGSKFCSGEATNILPVFNLIKFNQFSTYPGYWLRAVVSTTQFAGAGHVGYATYDPANYKLAGVRPLMYIG